MAAKKKTRRPAAKRAAPAREPEPYDDDGEEISPPTVLDILAASLLGLQRSLDVAIMAVNIARREDQIDTSLRSAGRPLSQDDVRKLVAQARGESPETRPRAFGEKKQRGDAEAHNGQ